mgnify:CR=1 FL=1
MVKVNCKTHGSDVERRDIWVDDWNKSNVDAVKASDFDALLTERDALAKQLAELRESYNEVYRKMANLAGDVGLFRVELRGMTVRAEAAEARVRELEHALRRASERLSWLRDHHCSSVFAREQAKLASDECWRVQAGERATASARAVQEPACQHDLQQSAPTVRVWHSIFEPEKQSAECNVCGSRWTLNGVGRG